MIVMKFGGTSVGSAERIRNAAEIVKSRIVKKPVVVVSAVTKITDALIKLANESANGNGDGVFQGIKNVHIQILRELGINENLLNNDFKEIAALMKSAKSAGNSDAKMMDSFQSYGEQMSSKIMAEQLNNAGIRAKAFNSWEIGFITSPDFGNAEPLESDYGKMGENIASLNLVPVITGFIGKTEKGEITTLGRGGSDYSAAIIGAAIGAEEIQIWTDVNGIMTTDPKIVKSAKTIEVVSFAEASELAYFGAKVLHPKTMLPAMKKNIPVRVLNSLNPENEGTLILSKTKKKNSNSVKAIACKKKITIMHIASSRMLLAHGFLAGIFDIFSRFKKSVDVVATSEVSVSLTIDNNDGISSIAGELEKFGRVEITGNKAIICLVGEGIADAKDIAGRTFSILCQNNIKVSMISVGASMINITFVVDEKNADKSMQALHKEFFG